MDPLIVTGLLTFLSGTAVKTVIDQVLQGRRDQRTATGRKADRHELALRSRLTWRDYAYELLRRLRLYTDEIPDPPEDPYTPTM